MEVRFMYRKIIIMAAMVLICTMSASAAVINQPLVDSVTAVMTLSGEAPGGLPYADVNIVVYRKGADIGKIIDFSKANLLNDIVSYEQITADEHGKYTAYIDMEQQPAYDYVIRVRTEGMSNYEEKPYYFATAKDKDDAVAAVKSCTNAQQLEDYLDLDNPDSMPARTLEITDPLVFEVQAGGLSEVLFKLLKEKPPVTQNDTLALITLTANMQYIYEGKATNILDYADMFGFPPEFVTTYTQKVTADSKTSFSSLFAGKRMYSTDELNKFFCDNVMMSVVNNIASWSYINYILETHYEYLASRISGVTINMSGYNGLSDKSKIGQALGGMKFSSLNDFASKINTAIANASVIVNNGGSEPRGSSNGGSIKFISPSEITAPPVAPEKIAGNIPSFTDIAEYEWAKESIEALAAESIISSNGGGLFRPSQSVLREELVKMIVLALKLDITEADSGLSDVKVDQWYYKYISAAKSAGIVKGNDDGTFGVGNAVTRQDVAAMVYRAVSNKLSLQGGGQVFNDDDSIGSYAKQAVYSLRNAGVISGVGDSMFVPTEKCTRAQAAKIIYIIKKLITGEVGQ
jgi:hypothetical protein